jgi:hypothetical protein
MAIASSRRSGEHNDIIEFSLIFFSITSNEYLTFPVNDIMILQVFPTAKFSKHMSLQLCPPEQPSQAKLHSPLLEGTVVIRRSVGGVLDLEYWINSRALFVIYWTSN